jgi:glycosyltransferase involved in cell wall biosynthesis
MVVHAHYPVGETRVQREALALSDRRIDVDVLCLRGRGEPARELVDGVTVHRLPIGRHRGRGLAWQLGEYLVFFVLASAVLTALHARRRYRTVQVHNLPDFLVFCALVPKLTGARVLLDLHDLMPEFMAAKRGRTLRDPLVRLVAWQERLACRFADQVITVTETWRGTLAERSAPPEKVAVVMNLADPRFFTWSPRDRTERRDTWRVVYHGTLTHRYGVDLLVRAVHAVVEDIPEIELSLLGDGDARGDLVELVAALGLAEKVSFSEGMLEVSDLIQAIQDADVGVVPNRDDIFTDGLLPTKLLEYVAVGTPVIAASTRGIRAEFDDSSVALFEPGDADALAGCLRALHHERSRLNELSRAAGAFSASHPWTAEADAYCALVRGAGAA